MAVSRNKLFIPGVWGPFWSGRLTIFFFHYKRANVRILNLEVDFRTAKLLTLPTLLLMHYLSSNYIFIYVSVSEILKTLSYDFLRLPFYFDLT